MTEQDLEDLIEAVFQKLGDPDRSGGLLAEIDQDFRNAFVEGDRPATLMGMQAALDELSREIIRVEYALTSVITETEPISKKRPN